MNAYEQQLDQLRQQLQQRDHEFEQNLTRLKAQSSGGDSRGNLQENIDMIRLQRDLRDKSDELRRLQTQSANNESVGDEQWCFLRIRLLLALQKNRTLEVTNAELLKEIDRLDRQIKEEQQRALQLRTELRNGSRSSNVVYEVKPSSSICAMTFNGVEIFFSWTLKSKIFVENVNCWKMPTRNWLVQHSMLIVNASFARKSERWNCKSLNSKRHSKRIWANEDLCSIDWQWRRVSARETKRGVSWYHHRHRALIADSKRDTDEEQRSMHLKYLEMKEKHDDLAEKMRFFERVRLTDWLFLSTVSYSGWC